MLERLCPICRWEGIRLPAGAIACAEHGCYDAAGDQARERERERDAVLNAADNVQHGGTPPACPDCGGSGLVVDVLRRAGEPLTAEEVEMLDSTRCYLCCGAGYLADSEAL